ncbi:MAG: TetR/AcrR family transcriptional regulator [Actinomycetia bacterium]|nr:TetR/AcrR family transcriptional regulator [Actinomycetes bacterium]
MHTPYHHGDLPNALRCAAAEVIAEKGVGNFSLREVARRAGVSHAAPGHHFGDVRGLLTSLAIEGFEALYAAITAAAAKHNDPAEKLIAMGTAYVTLATKRPAHAQVMFRLDIVDPEDPELMAAGLRAYTALHDVVAEIIRSEHLSADADDVTNLCWSTMQGLVELQPKLDYLDELQGRKPIKTNDRVRRFQQLILSGARSGARTR